MEYSENRLTGFVHYPYVEHIDKWYLQPLSIQRYPSKIYISPSCRIVVMVTWQCQFICCVFALVLFVLSLRIAFTKSITNLKSWHEVSREKQSMHLSPGGFQMPRGRVGPARSGEGLQPYSDVEISSANILHASRWCDAYIQNTIWGDV